MQRPPCTPDNSILETDLELAAKLDMIASLQINETERGFYLTATFDQPTKAMRKIQDIGLKAMAQTIEQLAENPEKVWYLATRRERHSPRLHRHLGRLNDFMREKYPTEAVILLRNQTWPGKAVVRTRGARAKQSRQQAN